MVERIDVPDPRWSAVDAYIVDKLCGDDPVLDAVLASNLSAGLPDIDVSPAQGRLLTLLALASRAKRVLEVGTLGGYSAICLARGMAANGHLVTLEIDPHHAEVARENIAKAELDVTVEVITGPALVTLGGLSGPFDLTFIDADKQSNAAYVKEALRLSRPGAMIVVDNVIREGRLIDMASDDPRIIGTRALFDMVQAEPRLTATAIQTVGAKKWDGFLIAVVCD